MGSDGPSAPRIVSLDQFRGYTVLGMFLVNFIGGFNAIHPIFKHHNTYCSYADTIMPQFFFAVGFAYRLTFLRRLTKEGSRTASWRVLRRNLGLILLGIVLYHLDGYVKTWAQLTALTPLEFFKKAFLRDPFETLVHIGVTAIWIMPVIARSALARIVFMICSAGLHLALSYWFYYHLAITKPVIDGGPLGFMTWSIPMLAGSFAYDAWARASLLGLSGKRLAGLAVRLAIGGGFLMMLGYAFSCVNRVTDPNNLPLSAGFPALLAEPPFKPPANPETVNIWTMSQRAGSISYLTFGTGLSLAVYALFVLLSDLGGLYSSFLRTLGSNALAGYIIHSLVGEAVKPYAPNDSPLWYVLAAFGLFLGICYVFIRHLEKNGIYLRL